jgi:putative transposase
MSRPASPWENGKCESFIKTLKQEEIDARPYQDYEDLRLHIREFIEQIYNQTRMHSALNYRSPIEFEQSRPAHMPASLILPRHQEVLPG